MKKLITICIAILFATQLSAQRRGENSNPREQEIRKEIEKRKNFRAKLFKRITRKADRTIRKSAFIEKLDSNRYENFNGTDWEIDSYSHYNIDANGNLIEEYYYYWSSNNLYVSKDSFTYDNNRISLSTSFSFYNNIWSVSSKTEYEYNTDGNILKKNSFYWNSGNMTWEQSRKTDYEYDANKNEITNTQYYWTNNAWLGDYKEESAYDVNNRKIKSTSYNWDIIANDWVASYVTDITNNSDGNMTSGLSKDWDEDNNIWVNDEKQTFTYDANKNISTAVFEYWDEDNNIWEEGEKATLNYDLNVSIDDVLFPTNNFDGLNIVNKILSLNYFEKDNNNWVNSSKETFYYSPFTTSRINKNNVISTLVYPNPASDVVNFDLSNISSVSSILIFDINGKQVANYNVDATNTAVNISQLNAGIYIYKIVGNDNISSGKLVKE